MGGITDEVRGQTKISTYLAYAQLAASYDGWSHDPNPKNKKECKRQMMRDPATGEWVLHFHFHS